MIEFELGYVRYFLLRIKNVLQYKMRKKHDIANF